MNRFRAVMELLGYPTVVRGAVRSSLWASIRKEHLVRHPVCIACGDYKKAKEVHHIVPVHIDPSKELELDNLVTLCADQCHIIFGHYWNWSNYNPDVLEMCCKAFAGRVAADKKRKGGNNVSTG